MLSINIKKNSLRGVATYIHRTYTSPMSSSSQKLLALLNDSVINCIKDFTAVSNMVELMKNLDPYLRDHANEEEKHLFPLLSELERNDRPCQSSVFAVSLQLHQMERAHEEINQVLRILRFLSTDFTFRESADSRLLEALQLLEDLESSTNRHIHSQSTVLFPRIRNVLQGY